MSVVITLLFLYLLAFCIGMLFNKTAEDLISPVVFSVILLLYVFYCFNLLRAGRIIVYLLSASLVVLCSARFFRYKNRKIHISSFFTPQFFVFWLTVLAMFVLTFGRKTVLWDELRLWSAVPKSLWSTEKLQLTSESQIFSPMQSYPPGMHLFVYFLTALSSQFHESDLFWSYAIYILVVFAPMLKHIEKGFSLKSLLFVMVVLGVPCLFTSNGGDFGYFYYSLFIDPVLGIMAGYCFWLSASAPFSSPFNIWRFCVVLGVTGLLKDSGLCFALMALCNAIAIYVADKSNPFSKKEAAMLSAPALACTLPFLLWNILTNSRDIVRFNQFEKTIPSFIDVKALIKAAVTQEIWLLELPFTHLKLSLSFVICIFLAVIAACLATKKYNDLPRKTARITAVSMTVSFAFFIFGMCDVYAPSFPSFQRYMGSLIACSFTYLIMRFLSFSLEAEQKSRHMGLICGVLTCLFLISLVNNHSGGNSSFFNAYAHNITECASENVIDISEKFRNANARSKIYLYIDGDESTMSLLHHRVYFELIGSNCTVGNFYDDINIGSKPGSISQKAESWVENLRNEDYSYIYVLSAGVTARDMFKDITSSGSFSEKSLYLIGNDNHLIQIENI